MKNYEGKEMRLFDCSKEINIGDYVFFPNGEKVKVVFMSAPHKASSTGRVYVKTHNLHSSQGYFPGVFDCKFLPV